MTATVDLDEVVSFRASISSLREQASSMVQPAFVPVDFNLCRAECVVDLPRPVKVKSAWAALAAFACVQPSSALHKACGSRQMCMQVRQTLQCLLGGCHHYLHAMQCNGALPLSPPPFPWCCCSFTVLKRR